MSFNKRKIRMIINKSPKNDISVYEDNLNEIN